MSRCSIIYLMNQPADILKLMDNIPNLRPVGEKGLGMCFGITVTLVYGLFAGVLKECQAAADKITKEIGSLQNPEDIQQRALALAKNSRLMGFVSSILIAQDPANFTNLYFEITPPPENQLGYLSTLFEFFSFGLPDERRQIKVLNGFTVYFDKNKLETLLNNVIAINHPYPIAFLLSYIGHTWNVGYDPKTRTWFLSNIRHSGMLEHPTTVQSLTNLVWSSLNERPLCAINIVPVIHSQDTSAERYIEQFHQKELEHIQHAPPHILLQILTSASFFNDAPALLKLNQYNIFKHPRHSRKIVDTLSHLSGNNCGNLFTHLIRLNFIDSAEYLAALNFTPLLNKPDSFGETPLTCALKNGHSSLARSFILNSLVNLEMPDGDGVTPLSYAIKGKFFRLARLILSLQPVNIKCVDDIILYREGIKFTALHGSLYVHDMELFKHLILHGANIHARDNFDGTPLHLAAAHQTNLEAANILIQRGADVNAITFEGNTPLHIAAIRNNPSMCEILPQKGANCHAKNRYGQTALDIAKSNGYQDAASALEKAMGNTPKNTLAVWQYSSSPNVIAHIVYPYHGVKRGY